MGTQVRKSHILISEYGGVVCVMYPGRYTRAPWLTSAVKMFVRRDSEIRTCAFLVSFVPFFHTPQVVVPINRGADVDVASQLRSDMKKKKNDTYKRR